jgi:hypothetical protein
MPCSAFLSLHAGSTIAREEEAAMQIDEYVAKLPGWQQVIVERLISCVTTAVPDATVAIKWSQPVFTTNGPFCYIKPAKAHVSFGFWWGARMNDPNGVLEGSGDKMRHMKFADGDEINCPALTPMIAESNRLNHELGDPTRTKA